MTEKYRKELTPNNTFQPNNIFVRNNLFEKIIKRCKATTLEFLKLKEKLCLCLDENICDEQELISRSDKSFKEENIFTQHDVKSKQLKEENEKLRKEENQKLRNEENEQLRKENEQLRKNNIVKEAEIKESIEKTIEIKIFEEDKNMTDSYPNRCHKNKFKNILAIIGCNKFNYRHKISEFRYIEIKDLVNNIKINTISKISGKKSLNTLNEIKNAGIIKYKKRTAGQKELLNLFNDLWDTILIDKTLESESQKVKNENKNNNENDETLMSSKDDERYYNENENNDQNDETLMSSNENNENEDDETMSQNEKIKDLNDLLDEIIDKSKNHFKSK